VGAAEIADIEPACRGVAALHSPATGIVDFGAVARALERELRASGVTFALGCTVSALRREHGQTVIAHAGGRYRAAAVNSTCVLAGESWPSACSMPFDVAWRAFCPAAAYQPEIVRGMVYPVPTRNCPSSAST
jgi:glycine/D-amino acid oxidase-like deaminating enzyme